MTTSDFADFFNIPRYGSNEHTTIFVCELWAPEKYSNTPFFSLQVVSVIFFEFLEAYTGRIKKRNKKLIYNFETTALDTPKRLVCYLFTCGRGWLNNHCFCTMGKNVVWDQVLDTAIIKSHGPQHGPHSFPHRDWLVSPCHEHRFVSSVGSGVEQRTRW